MFYIKNKKKYFLGLALLFFFNASAFSIDAIHIAVSILNFLPNIEVIAASEYEHNSLSEDSVLENIFNTELKDRESIFTTQHLPFTNINDFVQEFIVVTNNLKKRIIIDFKQNGYISKNIFYSIYPTTFYTQTLYIPFSLILNDIFYFYDDEENFFFDYEYYDFTQALQTSKLLESEKESLFKALQKINPKTSSS